MKHNKKELQAISELEAAFKNCSQLGIRFSVMDSDLLFANKRLYKAAKKIMKLYENNHSGSYPAIGYCQNVDNGIDTHVNTSHSMDSCGGW